MRKDKPRDIARGVLPSTARKGARDNKRHFHAGQRHAQRQANHAIERHLSTVSDHGTLAHDPDLFDDFEDPILYDGYTASTTKAVGYDGNMKYIVARRRDADKLGPLINWASATERTKMIGWDDADKIAYFKAILPDTLQGRHALGHVKQALQLSDDEFGFRFYREPTRTTLEDFRNALARCLATRHGRRSLRDLLHEEVPVAGHSVPSNNGHFKSEQARDENGFLRYNVEVVPASPEQALPPTEIRTPIMVDVWVPQMISVTCDDCTFLRNDPLATQEAVKRFISLIWDRPRNGTHPWYVRHRYNDNDFHGFDRREIIDHVLTF